MAKVKIYRTSGSIEEFNALSEEPINHVRIFSANDVRDHFVNLGEVLFDKSRNGAVLVVRDESRNRIDIPSLRVAILKMINHFVDIGISGNSLIISSNQFFEETEMRAFTCTIEEFCLTWFRDAIPNELSIIICDCEDEDDE